MFFSNRFWMQYCCSIRNSVSIGIMVIIVLVIIIFMFMMCLCERVVSVIGKVQCFWLVNMISGYMKLFYVFMKVKIVRVISIGLSIGSMIWKKMCSFFVLLMCVVLSSLFGIECVYWCIRKMLNMLVSVGMIILLKLLIRFSCFISRNSGSIVICVGIISVVISIWNRCLWLMKLSLVKVQLVMVLSSSEFSVIVSDISRLLVKLLFMLVCVNNLWQLCVVMFEGSSGGGKWLVLFCGMNEIESIYSSGVRLIRVSISNVLLIIYGYQCDWLIL